MPTQDEVSLYIEDNEPPLSVLIESATQMIDDYIGGATVPPSIYDFCVSDLTQNLLHRWRSPGGIMTFGDGDVVTRLSKDPMSSIYPLLAPYTGGFC